MKTSLLAALLVLSAEMSAACTGEAQIIAKVTGLQRMGSACFAAVTHASITTYQENKTCPLMVEDVIHSGIEIGIKNEDHCMYHVGSDLSGVLFVDVDGTIRLEK